MKKLILSFALGGLLAATQAWALPVLQIGAPGGAGEGTYANYQGSTSTPTESNTAITSGSTLFVAGLFGSKTLTLSGKSSEADWGSFLTNGQSPTQIFPDVFNSHGDIFGCICA